MALPRKLKNMMIFNDGNSYQGIAEEITLPKLTRKFEAYRGGGMGGAVNVDLGLEDGALDAEITLGGIEPQVFRQWATTKADGIPLRFMGSYQRDDTGETSAVEIVMRGRFAEFDFGNYKYGDNSQTKLSVKNVYYKLTIDSEVLIEIDTLNMVEVVGGDDRQAEHRRAIGL
ncbi:phage major tail tube protein [Sodalis sp.]|uniref:phage major tail tube protein n=1 Tax=Sodalis sp. (in: enterobacteria) TaxID=1898979 RepID=UPI002FEAD1D4